VGGGIFDSLDGADDLLLQAELGLDGLLTRLALQSGLLTLQIANSIQDQAISLCISGFLPMLITVTSATTQPTLSASAAAAVFSSLSSFFSSAAAGAGADSDLGAFELSS
jgi:hypothetical protein